MCVCIFASLSYDALPSLRRNKGRVGGDDGRVGLGLVGDGHSLDGCRTMGDEVTGCEEVVLESATGTCHEDPLGGVLFALRSTGTEFPDCAFPSIANDTHIVGLPARVVEAFLHFVAHLALLGLSVHPSKRGPLPGLRLLQHFQRVSLCYGGDTTPRGTARDRGVCGGFLVIGLRGG